MPSTPSNPSPEIPPQTITLSSDQLGKEMADRLRAVLEPFALYRSGAKVAMKCLRCQQLVLSSQFARPVMFFMTAALRHECELADD